MVQKRWSPYLKMKTYPAPALERDIPFYEVPGTDRKLLCDVWSPADGNVSGLALIYFHGSGWFTLDKDFGTRPFFHHLAALGHTVMDVAYRLCPEVDIYDMMGDVKQAVAWMKRNASQYGVDPNKIVLGGGSAGCHLALLAAYAPQQPEFTPQELADVDLSACGVISYYGPSDLRAGYERYTTKMIESRPAVPIGTKMDPVEGRNYAGRLDILLGCHPQESPEVYELASPVNHVHPGCPPTLLIQGEQDMLVSPKETLALYTKLVEAGVPSVYVNYPFTEHAFDLLLPQVSPPAQSALYDVDRFLALLLNKD
jgi:acetyl esterase/lipase